MKVIGVIPARFGSTRFPGKPLALILGKSLLQWVVERARQSKLLSEIVIATDDIRIMEVAKSLNCRAVMTDSALPTGTDRVWRAIKMIESKGITSEIVVNIQGDEPLITGNLIDQLIEPFQVDQNLEMATLGRPLTEDDLASANTAKIVVNFRDEAIYFSRFPIPYSKQKMDLTQSIALKHVGIYAYNRLFLDRFCSQPVTSLEIAESLEQLRALYLGARIKVVRVNHESWGVDTPADVLIVEEKLCRINRN